MYFLQAGLIMGAIAAIGSTDVLNPTVGWRLNYSATDCVATRSFGSRTLAIRPAFNGESYEIILIEPGKTDRFAAQFDGSVRFDGEPINTTVLVYSDRKSKTKFFKYRLKASDMSQARGAPQISLRVRRGNAPPIRRDSLIGPAVSGSNVDLQLSQMAALLREMDKCTADLRQFWNDSPESAVVVKPVQGDVSALFSSLDYPSEAYVRGQGGTTRSILLIDETGKVASCYVAEPSGIAAVDAMSCQVLAQRGKFSPALDAQGKPVRSIYYPPRVTFRMEN